MNLALLTENNIDLDWCNIGLWLTQKGEVPIKSKSILIKFKDVNYDKNKALEVGVNKLLGLEVH